MAAAEFWTRVYSLFSSLGRETKVLPSEAQVGKPHKCARVCMWACMCDHIHSCSTESGTYENLKCEAASAGTTRDPADTPYGERGGRGVMEPRNNRWSFFQIKVSLGLKILIKMTIFFLFKNPFLW